MSEPLRTLILQDRASEAKLVVDELERGRFDPKGKRVETEEQYVSQREASPEVILRKQAEVVLKESERRFREMLENVELIAMTLDRDGMVTFCNDYLLRVTGWKREEGIGADWVSKFIPDANAAVKKVFFETIEAGEVPSHYENPIKTRTGELREIAWNNTMLRDIAGNIVGTASLG